MPVLGLMLGLVLTFGGVARERVEVAGFPEPHTPPALNRSLAFRYADPDRPPRAVLVLIPGLSGGAGSLSLLARALAARGSVEVWVWERRSNLLEDHTGLREALRTQNPTFAVAYYFAPGFELRSRRFAGPDPQALRALAHWGLDVHLRDLHALLGEIRRRRPGVPTFLGGHSLGGVLAALYAAYDFDTEAHPDPGLRPVRGLVFLDGLPVPVLPPVDERTYRSGFTLPGVGRVPGVEGLVQGRVPPYLAFPTLNPSLTRALSVAVLLARFRPQERSGLPIAPTYPMPLTNEAALGMSLDDNAQRNFALRLRLGLPDGTFELAPDPSGRSRGLVVLSSLRPHPGRELVGWRNGPEVGEPTDLRELASAAVDEETDFSEWYFPLRLLLDVAVEVRMETPSRVPGIGRVRSPDTLDLPMLSVGAGQGLLRHPWMHWLFLRRTASRDATVHILPEAAHLDVVTARENPAVPLLLRWMENRIP
ncbi:MAG: lysophospholipase [Armatimonadetes bacterium]|nr:lysophospholipase [Armatimonadota bacterium]MDW8154268.1 alpha/beta hydrolase [Armatimonadota bacterium]